MLRLILIKFSIIIITSSISLAQGYGGWYLVDSLNEGRYSHSAIQLEDGNVLIVGGAGPEDARVCEIYDVNENSWRITASTKFNRGYTSLVMLDSKKILSVGSPATKICEIYDPEIDKWEITDSLKIGRVGSLHKLTKLFDGRILLTGGRTNDYINPVKEILNSYEIYDEIIGKWITEDTMNIRRSSHTATLLKDGRVLVTGGEGISLELLVSCEIYNPVSDKWAEVAPMNVARAYHQAILLSTGKILVIGGESNHDLLGKRSCELYDPEQNKWDFVESIQSTHTHEAAFLLNDRDLLLFGTNDNQELVWEIYDVLEFRSKYLSYEKDSNWSSNKIQLKDDRILISGGVKTIDYIAYFPEKKCKIFDKNYVSVADSCNNDSFPNIIFNNYPNPFNNTTRIKFFIEKYSHVVLSIYNLIGQKIEELLNDNIQRGYHEVTFSPLHLASGIYISRIVVNGKSSISKMILLK